MDDTVLTAVGLCEIPESIRAHDTLFAAALRTVDPPTPGQQVRAVLGEVDDPRSEPVGVLRLARSRVGSRLP
ncbi:MAG: hypothetical protein ACRD0R_02345 [Acidimicrobiales bacterium]